MNTRPMNPWEEFYGNHKLVTDETSITTDISPHTEIAKQLHTLPWDDLARQHGHAFKTGKITAERFYSILELRAISQIATQFSLIPLSTLHSAQFNIFAQLLTGTIRASTAAEHVNNALNTIDPNEAFIIMMDIKTHHWDPRIYNLLMYCHSLGILHLEDVGRQGRHLEFAHLKTIRIFLPSVTARKYFTDIEFEKAHPTPLVGRVGALTINDIEAGIRQYKRYATFSYPGVEDPKAFHGIIAPVFFLTLHDELHRRLMSAIPTHALDNLFLVVDRVRAATGIQWSRELWNTIDLEIDIRNITLHYSAMSSSEPNPTQILEKILVARRFSDLELLGLFTVFSVDEPLLDTTLIILIDFIENESFWQERGIEYRHFGHDLTRLLRMTSEFLKALDASLPIASKVAIIKDRITLKDSSKLDENNIKSSAALSSFQKIHGYIQMTRDKAPTSRVSKKEIILESTIMGLLSQITMAIDDLPANPHRMLLAKAANAIVAILNQISLKDHIPLTIFQDYRMIAEMLYHLLIDPGNARAKAQLVQWTQTKPTLKPEIAFLLEAAEPFHDYLDVHMDLVNIDIKRGNFKLFDRANVNVVDGKVETTDLRPMN